MSTFKLIATTLKEANTMWKYGRYNIPLVAKVYNIYSYRVIPRVAVINTTTNVYYWATSSPANTLEDMYTGAGNPEAPGWPTLQALYSGYAPIKFWCTHEYVPKYAASATNEMQTGEYYLVGCFDASATNPLIAWINAADSIFLEQGLRSLLQAYIGKMRIINITGQQMIKKKMFSISNSTSVPQLLGRNNLDIWETNYASATTTNPTNVIYYHSMLIYNSPSVPIINMSTLTKTTVKSLFNQPYPDISSV